MQSLTVVVLAIASILLQLSQATSSSQVFQYSRGPVPETFSRGTRYPDRNETDECRPIRLRVTRQSRLYRTQLVTNSNPNIIFRFADARVMTSRMQTRLNALAVGYFQQYSSKITVLRAWSEYSADDNLGDPHSLHYEGKGI